MGGSPTIFRMGKLKSMAHYFLLGMGSVLTVQAGPRPAYLTRSNDRMLGDDWKIVGVDIDVALSRYESEYHLVQPELDLTDREAISKTPRA